MIEITVWKSGDEFYVLTRRGGVNSPGEEWWLENGEGEGMSMSDMNLFQALDQYFKENF